MTIRPGNQSRFLGTRAAAEYTGIPFNTLKQWRSEGKGPRFFKPRGRALYDVRDLDEFIQAGVRPFSVRASREARNVALSTR